MNILEVFEFNQHFVAMMNIINSARLNPPEIGHKHHIIPKCYFKMNNLDVDNSAENIVLLSKEQHAKVHQLMALCAKDERLKRNMIFGARFLGLSTPSLKGLHLSEEHRRKLSESLKGKSPTKKGKATSIFGKAFIEHFGIPRCDDIKLYKKEYKFFKKNNKFSWEV